MHLITRGCLIATVFLIAYCAILIGWTFPWFFAVLAVIVAACAFKKGTHLWAHGTARWADITDLHGMIGGNGMIVGTIDGRRSKVAALKKLFNPDVPSEAVSKDFLAAFARKPPQELVRLNKAVHTAVFAPTGVGKGVSVVVPYLLTCPDSMVVVDFKGENYALTADARRKMGHTVVRLDPFGPGGDSFNPLDFIDRKDPLAIDYCRALAAALVFRTGEDKEPMWNDSAEIWIAAMTACIVNFVEGEHRSLQGVRGLLTSPKDMQAAIASLIASKDWGGMLSRMGNALTRYVDKELGSVMTTVNRHMSFLDTLATVASTAKSTFDPADLVRKKMTIYLVIPPEHMKTQAPLLRMWIGSFMTAVVRQGLQEKNKVHFMLDEAASLGHMEAIDNAVDKYRGYGIRLLFLYQSLGQLKECFPNGQEQTLLSNVTQVFFGVNDKQTADYVSDRLGEETIVVASGGTTLGTNRSQSSGGSGGSSSTGSSFSSNDNWAQNARKLLKPEEVLGLSPRVAITFTPGVPPLWTTLVRYYEAGFGKAAPAFWPTVRTAVDAVCLLLIAVLVALALTGALAQKAPAGQDFPVPAEQGQFK